MYIGTSMTFEMKLLLFVDTCGNMRDLWMTTQFSISRKKTKYIYWITSPTTLFVATQVNYPYYKYM
jgi:hypothetical protein